MRDYILFMHDDALEAPSADLWAAYFESLRGRDAFQGGSAIGIGEVMRKGMTRPSIASHITGYIRIRAANIDAVKALVVGNPIYERGGSVEVRELPTD